MLEHLPPPRRAPCARSTGPYGFVWPLAIAWIPAPALAADHAGVAAAVRGQVTLARVAIPAREVVSGEDIFMRDNLRSGISSGMQILLLDETVFTIGPQSEIVVDEFVYDPSTSAGKVGATVVKGVFRFVTGKIAHKNPSDMRVALPSGDIGVRGTIVAGRVDDASKSSLVVLLGDSGAGKRGPASIEVCNAGACEQVTSPGFGVRIDGANAVPTKPFRVAPEEIDGILRDVSNPERAVAGGASGDAGKLDAGNLPPGDGQSERDARRRLQGLNTLDSLSDRAAQDARTPQGIPTTIPEPPPPPPAASGAFLRRRRRSARAAAGEGSTPLSCGVPGHADQAGRNSAREA